MTQPQRQQAAETILEKKTANKYEKRAFEPSVADLVKQIRATVEIDKDIPLKEQVDELMTDDKKKEVAAGLEILQHPEQQKALLTQADPRNNIAFFSTEYKKWARDNSNTHYAAASFGSKVSYWLGSTLVASPASIGVPDYVWYLPKDRLTVFRGHFNPKTIMANDKYILHTNRYIYFLRDKLQKRIAFWFLIFGLAFGALAYTGHKASVGISYVKNQIKANGDAEKFKEQQKADLKADLKRDAKELVADYKAGKVTDKEFLAKRDSLNARELEINKNN